MPLFRRPPSFTLNGGLLVMPDRTGVGMIRVAHGRIETIGDRVSAAAQDAALDLDGAYVYPGLINAHDHLELNLLPRTGQGPYPNSYAWFDDVNRLRDDPIMANVLAVPMEDRLLWGGYRNLFSGVTIVAHHNPYHRRLFGNGFPVRVLRRYRWSHSLRLAGTYGGRPEEECRKAGAGEPFIIHLAEGVDEVAAAELLQLDRLGALQAHTVLVHGVGLAAEDHTLLRDRGAGLIWCPSSNLFLFNRTADIPALLNAVPIALGTDSTLSGQATLFHEMRTAASLEYASPQTLFHMVTMAPAQMLGLGDRAGRLSEGCPADLLVLAPTDADPYETLITATPATIRLVVIDGIPRFGDAACEPLFTHCGVPFDRVRVMGALKLVTGGFGGLMERLRRAGMRLPIEVEMGI